MRTADGARPIYVASVAAGLCRAWAVSEDCAFGENEQTTMGRVAAEGGKSIGKEVETIWQNQGE